jgi:hypothetical protein
MNTLLVKHVEPYSVGDESASVTLCSSFGELVVFCYPCSLKVGDLIENHLSAFDVDARAAYLSDWPENDKIAKSTERLDKLDKKGPYAYQGCGRVIEKASGLVSVLGFCIEFDDIPCDDFVEFECYRIDL